MGFDDLAARMRKSHGVSASSLAPPPAGTSAEEMIRQAQAAERRDLARKDIVIGGLLLAVGLAITLFTHASASRQGGTYVIAYGPIIWGGVRLCRGFLRG